MIKVGVVGVGFMGEKHARIFHELPNVELTAVCDSNEMQVRQISNKYHATPYRNYSKMLQNEDLNAISIATPTRFHTEVILNSIDYVKNILVEKPIALSFEEAERAIDHANRRGVNLMVGHIERFNPVVNELRKIVTREEPARPIVACARRIGPYSPRIRDQGVILGLAIHDIDILRYTLSCEVEKIYANTLTIYSAFEDYATIVLELEKKGLCTIEASQLSCHRMRTFDVTLQGKHIRLDLLHQTMYTYRLDKGKILERQNLVKKGDPLRIELQHFINVALGKDIPQATAKDGLKSLSVALAALESAKIGLPLNLFNAYTKELEIVER